MNTLGESGPSPEQLALRIRSRLIQYLESVVAYRVEHPPWDLNEQLEQWQDWVPVQRPLVPEGFPQPAYTPDEQSALLAVDAAWEALCDATPGRIRDESAVFTLAEWTRFVESSKNALGILQIRGPFYEEQGG